MVYSGIIVFYGIHLTDYVELFNFLELITSKSKVDIFRNKNANDFNNNLYNVEVIEEFLSENGCTFSVDTKKCCYNDGSFFIGFELGEFEFIHRDYVEDFSTFEKFEISINCQMTYLKNVYQKEKPRMDTEFDKMIALINANCSDYEEFEDFHDPPRIYKYANDCEHCS